MRPIATDGVGGWSVSNDREPCKNGWTDRDTIWDVDFGEPEELRIRWDPDPPTARDICEGDDVGIYPHAVDQCSIVRPQ